jgi:hypothetical protein
VLSGTWIRHHKGVWVGACRSSSRAGLVGAILVLALSACSPTGSEPVKRPPAEPGHLSAPAPVSGLTNFGRQFFFTPRPASGRPATTLSARRAWAVWSNGGSIPSFQTVQFGAFTDNVFAHYEHRPHYRYRDRPVWAFRTSGECMPDVGDPPIANGQTATAAAAPPAPCTDWTVLDGLTGQSLVTTSQGKQG